MVVEASRYALAADAASGAQRLDAVDLANQPNVADDPIRALRRLPGVVQGGLSAASNLRGGETNEVLVLLDGFPLRQPFHLPGYQSPFSLLEEDLIDSIDVFTGGFPARYGNRLAGVFDIESAEAGQAPKTAIGISFINAHARSAGESDDGTSSWRASARQGTLRPVLQYLSVDAGRPSYSDLSLTGTHRPRADLQLSGNVLWATDEYALNDDDERAEISSRTRYSWLSAEYTPSETLSGNLWLGHSRIEIDRVGDVDKPEFAIGNVSDHRDANLWDARASLNWHWSDRSRLNMGFEWTAGSADYRYDSAVTFPDAWRSCSTVSRASSARCVPNRPSIDSPCLPRSAGNSANAGCRKSACACRKSMSVRCGSEPGIRASAFGGKCARAPGCVPIGDVSTRPMKCMSWPSPTV